MRALSWILLVALASGCGSSARPPTAAAPAPPPAAPGGDPHRKLTGEDCGAFYDFLKQKSWLDNPDAQRDAVIASCLEMGATQALYDCIFASQTREEAERCQ
jgi:hypothetical protein